MFPAFETWLLFSYLSLFCYTWRAEACLFWFLHKSLLIFMKLTIRMYLSELHVWAKAEVATLLFPFSCPWVGSLRPAWPGCAVQCWHNEYGEAKNTDAQMEHAALLTFMTYAVDATDAPKTNKENVHNNSNIVLLRDCLFCCSNIATNICLSDVELCKIKSNSLSGLFYTIILISQVLNILSNISDAIGSNSRE